jgi:hypothetical protein
MAYVMWFLRDGLGALFLFSALQKLKERTQFEIVVFLLSGILRRFYKSIAIAALFGEAIAGALLISNVALTLAYVLSGVLMLIFDAALVILYVGHPGLDCGCFGSKRGSSKGVQPLDLLRNALLTMWVLALAFWRKRVEPIPPLKRNFVMLAVVLVLLITWDRWMSRKRSLPT